MANSNRTPSSRCVDAAKAGDFRAQRALVARFTPLVLNRVGRCMASPTDREDLVQDGFLALVEAFLAFQSSRGPFPAFADVCVSSRVRSEARRNARHSDMFAPSSFDAEQCSDRAFGVTQAGGVRGDDTPYETCAGRDETVRILRDLSVLERRAIVLSAEGYSSGEVAERLGVSRKSVENALDRVRRKARRTRMS